MDIAALGAAPIPDTASLSGDTPAGAADLFAALLDQVAGTSGESLDASSAAVSDSADEDDVFDELAALAMTSLLSLVTPVATPDAVDEEDLVTASEISEGEVVAEATAIAEATSQAALVDATPESQLVAVGPQAGGDEDAAAESTHTDAAMITPAFDANVRTAAATEAMPADDEGAGKMPAGIAEPSNVETPRAEGARTRTAASAPKAEPDATPAIKPGRGSKPARTEAGKTTHVAELLENIGQAIAAVTTEQPIAAARETARGESTADTHTPTSTAARFARALERAAALTVNESPSTATTAATTSNGSGQSPFDDESAERATRSFTTPRHTAAGVSFTVALPTALDVRPIAQAVDAASHAVETTPVTIPERDVVAQLVQSLRLQFRDGIGEAVVKLKPEHLGSVQVSLKIENGTITATVQAEVAAVRQWLESQQDTLRTSLAEQGLRLERFLVQPDGERQSKGDETQQREHRRRQHQRARTAMSGKDQPVFEVTV